VVYAHSAVSGTFSDARAVNVVVDVDPRLVIDAPGASTTVAPRFTIAGWAVDASAASGSGIDLVQAWAYPAAGGPVFLGPATLGAARPDIAAIFGAAFGAAGYAIAASGLAPGAYSVVVYAHSAVAHTFDAAAAVSIVVQDAPAMSVDLPASGASIGG